MAEHSTPEERTEDPTGRRMAELRKEGSLHFSSEVAQVLSLLAGYYALTWSLGSIFENLRELMVRAFTGIGTPFELDAMTLHRGFLTLIPGLGLNVVTIVLAASMTAALAIMLQTDWNVREKKIEWKFDRLNPITGIKRIFSIAGVVNTLKGIGKLALVLPIAYFGLERFMPDMIALIHTSVEYLLVYTGEAMDILFWRIAYILIGFAIFDYAYSRYQWWRNNRMTKDEVKDERKSIEGDEVTKRRIINKGLQRIADRIKSSVPKADVIVTNPTHYAVALKYERGAMSAPLVLAKGKGFKALRIRAIATEHGVPIVERKPLARALYYTARVGAEIPYELYKAVAEVFAYLLKLKGGRPAPIAPDGGGRR